MKMLAMTKEEGERLMIYGKLHHLILPTFYEDQDNWIDILKKAISKIAYCFNSHRMIPRYVNEAYL